MTTTTHVDLDLVLTVAGKLRRLCQRAVKAGVSFSVFKQESWEAALVHVQDVYAGRQPSIRSDKASAMPAYMTDAWMRHDECVRTERAISTTNPGGRRGPCTNSWHWGA